MAAAAGCRRGESAVALVTLELLCLALVSSCRRVELAIVALVSAGRDGGGVVVMICDGCELRAEAGVAPKTAARWPLRPVHAPPSLHLAGGKSAEEAHAALKGTLADAKHEILHSFGINYAKLPAIFRRGSTLVRVSAATPARWLLIEDAVGEGAAAAVGGKGAKAGKAGKVKSKAVASTADCAVSGAGAAAGAERGGLTAAAAAPCSDAVEGDSERMAAPQRQAVSESGHDRCTDAARACSSSPAGSSAAAAGPDDRGAVFGAARPLVAETASASTSGPPSLASGDSGPRPGVATAPVTHNSSHPSADRGAEASAHDAGDAGLPDTDAGTALGALAMPSPSILLCFPDYNRGSFLARLFAAHPQ